MPVIIDRSSAALTKYEYGCDLRRLYPWKEVADPLFWGSAIASVRVGEATTPHSHDEEETFIIMSGTGMMTVDGESTPVVVGDVVYLPRGSTHTLANTAPDQALSFLTIFWGSPEARQAMRQELLPQAAE